MKFLIFKAYTCLPVEVSKGKGSKLHSNCFYTNKEIVGYFDPST